MLRLRSTGSFGTRTLTRAACMGINAPCEPSACQCLPASTCIDINGHVAPLLLLQLVCDVSEVTEPMSALTRFTTRRCPSCAVHEHKQVHAIMPELLVQRNQK